jgi:hypothetical protein
MSRAGPEGHRIAALRPVASWPSRVGAVVCLLVLAAAWFNPEAAMRAWLASAVFWSSIPIAALMLVMMMRLIPGAWDVEMLVATEAAILLMPLAAIVFVPVLIGIPALYAWVGQPQDSAFRAVYLTPSFFVLRTVLWFAFLFIVTFLLIARRSWSTPVSCIGLILFTLGGTVVATDWLMSLDPDFRSSGFGLYVLSIQATIAVAAIDIVVLVTAGDRIRSPAIPGGLLLTAVLLWAYFSYMQYVVIWSSDYPPLVRWYIGRASGFWGAMLWAIALLHGAATALLVLTPVLRNRRLLVAISGGILAGKALECAWLVLPAGDTKPTAAACLLFLVALAALGPVFALGWSAAFRHRIRARLPASLRGTRHA